MKSKAALTFLVLTSRLFLFLFFQALVALLLNSWAASEKYWLLTATLANIVCIAILIMLYKRDGSNFFKIFRFNRASFKKDILIFIGLAVVTIPVVMLPGHFLSIMFWGSPDVSTAMMFGPIDKWLVYLLLFAFPVTIALAELATYFVYVMPNLQKILKAKWLAIALPVVFLSIQHCTMPFIPDANFILYRALMFLPFAMLIGLSIHYRPSLFVYFAILHGLLDFGTAYMFLLEIK